jgi:TolB-like protein/tRNA A-37 threonylcarbamoyl transferase component Bud32
MPLTETQTGVCENCGALTDASVLGDELTCMACLLRLGFSGNRSPSGDDSLGPPPPDHIGPYIIARRDDGQAWVLGRGAMGITFRATDESLQRPVALKIINTNLGSHSAEARERFMREARAAAALRHPNVATVYQFGVREETGQFFYAMELVEGETLEERVRRLGPLDVLTAVDIALQVSAALEAAEEHGLVHRDLKPGNLMLVNASDGSADAPKVGRALRARRERPARRAVPTVKVIDFGVAKAVAEKTNAMALTHGGFVGTPAFASPEQFTNAPVDVRSDIYSLGATLWFLLTGHMLFSGRTIKEIQDTRRCNPLPIEQLKAAHVPRRLISLLTSMLAIEPAARPDGARELSARFQAIRTSITGRGKIAAHIALAASIVLLAATFAVREFHSFATQATPSLIPEKSIAVLPFENLSGDPNNAYFADGMQGEILTRLAKIADLKVISRASTQRYKGKPANLAQIAKKLGVSNILEGSVQKAADQVRVNVQLINAQTDSHLWADSYDQKLTDVFSVESEIAKRVANSLQAKLTGREEQALAVRPTNNPDAYDAYLRGVAFDARASVAGYSYSHDLEAKAAGFFEQAVQLDHNFAVAWARLSRANAHIYFNRLGDPSHATRGNAARDALQNAQTLEPDSPETLLALGYYQYWVLREYGLAGATFERLSKMLPGNCEARMALAGVARREGRWDESVAYFEQALGLDPGNVDLLISAAWTRAMLRQFPAALKLYDRALDIKPNELDLMASKAGIYQAQGKLQEAARLLSEINWQTPNENTFATKINQLRLERNHGEAVQLLQTRLAQFQFASQWDKTSFQAGLALHQRLAGDMSGARITAEQARNTLEQLCRDQPDNQWFAMGLSRACAAMGEKNSALKAAERAIILYHKGGGVSRSWLEENLAFIQAMVGEKTGSISTLSKLLQEPYVTGSYGPPPITLALLRLDPIWDPLRGDPAFQKLCQEKQDVTTNGH